MGYFESFYFLSFLDLGNRVFWMTKRGACSRSGHLPQFNFLDFWLDGAIAGFFERRRRS